MRSVSVSSVALFNNFTMAVSRGLYGPVTLRRHIIGVIRMKFCNECGATLSIEWVNHRYKCPRCGAHEPLEAKALLVNNHGSKSDKIIVIGKNERRMRTLPQTNSSCPKCGNGRAYWWMVQTRSADESSTQFFRCTRCGHTWREYS